MKTKLLTDTELRARWSARRTSEYTVEEGTILTPSARDFIREQGITLRFVPAKSKTMTTTPIPVREGKASYVELATGEQLDHKPEELTHLRGNLLVPKTHPQIAFRGQLDSLMALILQVQVTAQEQGETGVVSDLEELLGCTRQILGAEVKDQPLEELSLLGMDSDQLRRASHDVKGTFGISHPIPSHEMGRLCVELNLLRTKVREVELAAARAFFDQEGVCRRGDIIQELNRLSSCVYIIFCRKLSGYYDRREQG